MKVLLFSAVLCSLYVGTPAPIHASCRVKWVFNVDCAAVASKIIAQMNAWNTSDNCAHGGEKCLYTLKSHDATTITGTHTTPKKHYVDDLTFTLKPAQAACHVEGYSTSEVWYAVLDSGTNYCNLRNLLNGSGLSASDGFTETTTDISCTQFSSANCEKY